MKELLTTLQAHLQAAVPQARTITRWNNQLANEGQERPASLAMPALYLEVLGTKQTTISAGIQHGEGLLRVRHCTKSLRETDLAVFELEAAAYLALQNYSGGPLLIGLDRRTLYPDNNHAAVEMLIAEYFFKYTDDSVYSAHTQLITAWPNIEFANS